MTLRKRLHLASLALAAASLAAAGAMMPDPATAAEPTCLGRPVQVDMNDPDHPDTNHPDGQVILGTPGPDTINSGGGPDTICAGAGDDNVNAGGENDVVDGGTGDDILFGGDHDSDTLVYLTRTVPVVASVQGTAKVGASEVDTITDFETIFGGHKDDTLMGDDEANFFIGGDGNDTLNGEGGDDDFIGDDFVTTGIFGNGATGNGADTINGGSGNDTVDYGTDHASSVAVTLSVTGASGNNTDGDAGSRDTLKGVEDVHGTKGNDRITGNILANHLYGWSSGGSAGSGNDVLDGGPGDAADVLDGGDGTDTVSYASHTKGVQVDMVADQDNEGDEFSHVSHVIGSKFNDLVRDSSHRAIVLDGGAGVDNRVSAPKPPLSPEAQPLTSPTPLATTHSPPGRRMAARSPTPITPGPRTTSM